VGVNWFTPTHSLSDFAADIASKAPSKQPIVVSPIALAAITKIDAGFAWGQSINGLPPEQRLAVRQKEIAPLVKDLEEWMRPERAKLSRDVDIAKAMDSREGIRVMS